MWSKILLQATREAPLIITKKYIVTKFYIYIKENRLQNIRYIAHVRGRLNKQKVRYDRSAVANVTVYYLCLNMWDKEFMATMVPSYFPALSPSFLSTAYYSAGAFPMSRVRRPDVPNFLPIPAAV